MDLVILLLQTNQITLWRLRKYINAKLLRGIEQWIPYKHEPLPPEEKHVSLQSRVETLEQVVSDLKELVNKLSSGRKSSLI